MAGNFSVWQDEPSFELEKPWGVWSDSHQSRTEKRDQSLGPSTIVYVLDTKPPFRGRGPSSV